MNPEALDTVKAALRHQGDAMTADEVTARARPLERVTVVRALGELVRRGQAELHPCGEPRRYQFIRPVGFALNGQPRQREQKPVQPLAPFAPPPAEPEPDSETRPPQTLAERILELLGKSQRPMTCSAIARRTDANPEHVNNLLELVQVPAGAVVRLPTIPSYRIAQETDHV